MGVSIYCFISSNSCSFDTENTFPLMPLKQITRSLYGMKKLYLLDFICESFCKSLYVWKSEDYLKTQHATNILYVKRIDT